MIDDPVTPRMTVEQGAALRAPFPGEAIGKLPRVTCKDCSDKRVKCDRHVKARCEECGNYVSTQHVHLDYVGHAWVTHRLLEVDPNWDWEPVPNSAELGLPTPPGTMWIRLTVCGVTRFGVGDAQGKDGPDAVKEMIGDALRNAAMRFGVALDLWMKDRNASVGDHDSSSPARRSGQSSRSRPAKKAASSKPSSSAGMSMGDIRTSIRDRMNNLPEPARTQAHDQFAKAFGDPMELKPSKRTQAEAMVAAFEAGAAGGVKGSAKTNEPETVEDIAETLHERHTRLLLPHIEALSTDELRAMFDRLDGIESPTTLGAAQLMMAGITAEALDEDHPDGADEGAVSDWWNADPPVDK